MKKIIYCALAFAAGLFASSCQQENLEPVAKEGTVTYTVEAPAVAQTKAIGDGLNVTELIYEVWLTDADKTTNLDGAQKLFQGNAEMKVQGQLNKATVTLDLPADQHYTVLFWAQVAGTDVYETSDLTAVTYTNKAAKAYAANDERLAAFYAADFINNGVAANPTVRLTRPFAQINLGTLNERAPEKNPTDYTISIVNSKMTLKQVPTVFNVATKAATEPMDFEFEYNAVPSGDDKTLTVGTEPYYYAGMNYVFAGGNIELTYDIQTSLNGSQTFRTISNTIQNVPVKENYRTNIIGNLLTTATQYEVVVDADWAKEADEPQVVEVVTVSTAADLKTAIEEAPADAETNIKLDVAPNTNGEKILDLNEAFAELMSTKAGNDNYGVLIPYGRSIVLDLNGCTLTQTKTQTAGYSMIQVNGELTIIDSEGNGVISYTDAGNGGGYVSNTVYNMGKLTVKSGKIVNNSSETVADNGFPYAVDTGVWGESDEVITNIEGGELRSVYSPLRNRADRTDKKVETNISGGKFYGRIDHQQSSNNGSIGILNISGGEFHAFGVKDKSIMIFGFGANTDASNIVLNITGGKFNAPIHKNIDTVPIGQGFNDKFITGGEFNFDPSEFVAPGYAAEYDSEKGKYTVAKMWYMDAEDNYHILNAAGLKWVSENVNTMEFYVNKAANIFDNKIVYIENDIDFQGAEWRPIGDYAFSRTSFNGVFDGQNHTISNFKVTNPVSWTEKVTDASYGFFGNVKGTVKNLTIKNATVNPEGGRYSAALVGRLHDGGRIENCHVVGSSVTINHWQVGGIVGQNNNGNISNCSVTGSTITGKAAVGAIVGMDMAAGEHIIENCRVTNSALAAETIFEGYEMTYGLAVGLVNASGIILNLNDVVVENNTIKGVAANTLVGEVVDGAKVYVNGSIPVTTAAQLEAAIKAGGECILMNDVEVTTKTYQNVDFTLDGNGYTIRQVEGSPNEFGLFDSVTGKLTLKNIVFDGVKGGAVLRTTGAELTMDNVTVKNCEHTQIYGLFRLIGKNVIKNCKFENNKCTTVITFNTEGDGNTDPQLVQNCEFKNNTCSATAVVHYSTGGSATIDGNKFLNNTLTVSNGATLYLGFKKNCTVTNNLFDGNTVTATSKRSSGGLMVGNAAVVTGNAFVNNSVTVNGQTGYGNNVCASPYYAAIDLSGNYWGGGAPVENDDYYKEYNNYEVIINDYLTENPIK